MVEPTLRRCAVTALWCALVVPSTGVTAAQNATDANAAVIALANAERARRRLLPLEPSPRLIRAAQIHAEQMARVGRLAHDLPRAEFPRAEDRLQAVKYRWTAWAENVAFGQEDADDVLRSWMKSSGHRANILSTTVTEIGVGHARGKDGRLYWVQLFARPIS